MLLIKILLMAILVDAKSEWKFQIKRGGEEPARPFQYNQLLAMAQRKKKLYKYGTIIQKVQNRKLRNFLTKMTGKVGSQNNQQQFRINRLRKFHKN